MQELGHTNQQHYSRPITPLPMHLSTKQCNTNSPNCGICATGGLQKNLLNQISILYSWTNAPAIGQIISPSTLHPVCIKYSAAIICIVQILSSRPYMKFLPVMYLGGCVSALLYYVRTDTCQTRWRQQIFTSWELREINVFSSIFSNFILLG